LIAGCVFGFNARMTRHLVQIAAALIALLIGAPSARAQSDAYPSRNIRLFIPFAAAGVMDIVGRIVFEKVGASLRQTVVVENRPGAGGTIAMGELARSVPDGTIIAIADPAGSLAAGVSLYPKLSYDPRTSFAPIGQVGASGAVLSVSPMLSVKTIQEFVQLAKARRGELTYGSAGNGSPGHLNGELFKRLAGIEAIHVPYRVGSQAVTDLMTGQISFWISPIATVLPQIQAGQVRPLAVAGDARSPDLPGIPTIKETGLGDYNASTTYAFFVPAGTPQTVIDILQTELKKAVESLDVQQRLRTAGVEPHFVPASEVGQILTRRIAQWADVIKAAGISISDR
jgi:tripartite-type tricarboxylate transporter receptor subunit TctC